MGPAIKHSLCHRIYSRSRQLVSCNRAVTLPESYKKHPWHSPSQQLSFGVGALLQCRMPGATELEQLGQHVEPILGGDTVEDGTMEQEIEPRVQLQTPAPRPKPRGKEAIVILFASTGHREELNLLLPLQIWCWRRGTCRASATGGSTARRRCAGSSWWCGAGSPPPSPCTSRAGPMRTGWTNWPSTWRRVSGTVP